jgi:GNAT superfamily N-acetyltransferase
VREVPVTGTYTRHHPPTTYPLRDNVIRTQAGETVREHGAIEVLTAEERPDLWERSRSLFTANWPEYNNHGNRTQRYFSTLIPKHARFQVLLYDAGTDEIVGRGRTIPFRWDGTLEDLPSGMDAAGDRAIDDPGPPTALSALAAEVAEDRQRQGLSSLIIESMAAVARRGGLSPLVAPVRPSWKDRYPLTPIERYAHWVRADGLPFDPWLRVHARLGATLLRTAPKSLQIEAPVSDWEAWTGMAFPEDGEYVFPAGLAPLKVEQGIGSYWEPNIWMRHEV